ncbi:MAG: Ig-like domain-containing protein, partial [Campylobacterota bacterium]|nr:Ig-like domain-containing protein [Campylobacterota bacterium]
MANIDETLGQQISEDIEREEDQVSKQGGVGISLSDFTSSGVTKNNEEEESNYQNSRAEEDNTQNESHRNAEDDIASDDYNFSSSAISSTVINDIDALISDIALLDTMNRDIDINQDINLENRDDLEGDRRGFINNQSDNDEIDADVNINTQNINNNQSNSDETDSLASTVASTEVDSTVSNDTGTVNFSLTDIDTTDSTTTISSTEGTVTIDDNGQISFVPEDGFTGDATVTVEVENEDGETVSQTFEITVEEDIEDTVVVSEPVINITLTDIVDEDDDSSETQAQSGTVTINTILDDDIINANESQIDTTSISGTATGGDIEAGDSITITVNGNEYNTTVLENGTYSVEVSTSDLIEDSSVDVSVSSTNEFGNSVVSESARDITIDLSAQEGVVTIDPISDDNIINSVESSETITVTGTATGGDIQDGDSVSFNLNGTQYSTIVEDGSWSVDVSGSDLSSDTNFTVDVVSTDNAGNVVTTSQSNTHEVDTTVETPIVTFESAGDDNVYNAQEVGDDGTITAEISVSNNLEVGSIISINGEEQLITQEDIELGSISKDVAPGSDVVVNVTDIAGNTSNTVIATASISDTTVGTPTVSIVDDLNEDGVYNSSELGEDGTVTATIGLPDDAVAGDTLTINGESKVLSNSDIFNGSVEAEVEPGTTISITLTDIAGNTSNTVSLTAAPSDTETLNTTNITDESGDDVINATEVTSSDISGNIEVGSTINSLSITDGTNTVTVDPVDITINADGSYSVENVDLSSLNDGTLTTSVTSTDVAGNSTTSSDTIEKDTVLDEVTINNVDYTADNTPVFTGTYADSGVGIDKIEVTIDGNVYDANINNDGTWSVEANNVISDGNYEVSVTAYDNAGNIATTSDSSVEINTSAIDIANEEIAEANTAADETTTAQATADAKEIATDDLITAA